MREGIILEILEDELVGKSVMSGEGFLIGVIKDSVKDEVTGETKALLVAPSGEIELQLYDIDDKGNIVFPVDSLAYVKDAAILE